MSEATLPGPRAPSTRLALLPSLPQAPPGSRLLSLTLVFLAAAGSLATAVWALGAPLVLVAVVATVAMLLVAARPALATAACLLLLYLNVPAILAQRHGVPEAAAGAVLLLAGIPLLHRLLVRGEPVRVDATFGMMLAFLAVMLVSAVFSRDPQRALHRVQGFVLEGLLLYWLLVNALDSLAAVRRAAWTLVAAGALLSCLSLYQQVNGDYRQEFGGLAGRDYLEAGMASGEGTGTRGRDWARAQGPVGEPNRFGQVLLVLVPLGVFLARTAPSTRGLLLGGVSTAALLVGLGLTLSRGTLLALVVIVLCTIPAGWARLSRLLLATLALAIVVPLVVPSLATRLQSMSGAIKLLGGGAAAYQEVDGATLGRTTEMLAAGAAFLDHPVLGVGPGLYMPLYSVEYQQHTARRKFRDLDVPRRAHSLYVEMAAELGALGLLTFLGIVALLARRLLQARSRWRGRSPLRYDLATGLLLSLLAYLATAVTMHLSYERYFWLLVALASAGIRVMDAPRPKPEGRGLPAAPLRETRGRR